MGRVLCVVIGVMAAASALAAASPVERVAATRVPEAASAVRADGELNDAFWQTVPAITGFRQRDPREGAPPTFQTEARVAYDATTLYVFGRLHQKTVGLTGRLNYTVTPALSIQVYMEPFVSAGDYSNFKELANGRSKSYEGRFTPLAYGGSPDFNYRSFRTTNVLRWEYKPGSTLFAVWQQGREDTLDRGTFQFSKDFGGVFDAPARNVFLIKWAYWLNY
jgi:hypothetical protein